MARGLVNFDAVELPALLGRSTRELAKQLGTAYEREVVHRDDLVLLRRADDGGQRVAETRARTRPDRVACGTW